MTVGLMHVESASCGGRLHGNRSCAAEKKEDGGSACSHSNVPLATVVVVPVAAEVSGVGERLLAGAATCA